MSEIEERVDEVVRLVAAVYHREFKRFGFEEDMISEGLLNVYRKAGKFDPLKSSFSNFVSNVGRQGMVEFLKAEKAERDRCVSLSEFNDIFGYTQNVYNTYEYNKGVVDSEVAMIRRKPVKKVVALVLEKGSQKAAVKEFGYSKQYVSREFTKFKKDFCEKYKCEGGVICEK